MEYMLVFKQTLEEFKKADDPKQQQTYFGAWTAYIGAMAQAGIFKGGHGLLPPQTGTSVSVKNGKRHVQDGPFADTKEHLGGYAIIDVASIDEAIEWAARAPSSNIFATEVRPVMPNPK